MDGIEALEAFRSRLGGMPFDVVVTDMTMPRMIGTELAAELRRLQPHIPIILCTGYSEKIDTPTAEALGIQGFLMKPVLLKELAELVRKVLDNKGTDT